MLVLLLVGVVELLSFVTLRVVTGEWVTHGDLAARRREACAEAGEAADLVAIPERYQRALERPQALHPYLGFVMDPARHWAADDDRFSREAADFGFPHNVASLFQEPSDKKLVVAILGGSVAQVFAAFDGGVELQRLLRDVAGLAGREPVILCVAASGYKQPQQLMTLNYLLSLGAHFDIIVNIDGVNEVAHPPMDLLPKGVFPFYPYGWYWRTAQLDQEARRLIGALTYLRDMRAGRATFFRHVPLRWSMTAGLIWTVMDRKLQSAIARHERALLERKEVGRDYQTCGPSRSYASPEEMYRDIAAVWEHSSLLMHLVCSGLGIQYYHFLQPNQYVEGSKLLTAEELEIAVSEDSPWGSAVRAGYPLLLEAGRRLRGRGVRFHDLTRLFEHETEPLYIDDCCHFNSRGNLALAAEITRVIASGPTKR